MRVRGAHVTNVGRRPSNVTWTASRRGRCHEIRSAQPFPARAAGDVRAAGRPRFRSSPRCARDIAARCAGPGGRTFPTPAVSRTRGTKCRLRPTLPSPAAGDVASTVFAGINHLVGLLATFHPKLAAGLSSATSREDPLLALDVTDALGDVGRERLEPAEGVRQPA